MVSAIVCAFSSREGISSDFCVVEQEMMMSKKKQRKVSLKKCFIHDLPLGCYTVAFDTSSISHLYSKWKNRFPRENTVSEETVNKTPYVPLWYESILRKCVVHLWLLHFCQELDGLLPFHIFSLGNTQGMLFCHWNANGEFNTSNSISTVQLDFILRIQRRTSRVPTPMS